MLSRALYFTRKAAASIRESPWVSLLTSATIAAALVVMGAYALALENLEQLAMVWGRSASVVAYVDDTVPPERWEAVRAGLAGQPGVAKAVLVRPDEALARFRARGAEAAALVAGIDAQVLPASIGIVPAPGFVDLAAIDRLAQALRKVQGVAEVDYGREDFDRLSGMLELLRAGGLAGALLIALATAFIVSNTIRLTVYARRDEIGILGLVGATAWFIRVPFVIEGAIWGALGGGAAVATLWTLDRTLAPRLSAAVADVLGGLDVRLFAPDVALAVVAGGVLLGALASGIAVRRFLDVELR